MTADSEPKVSPQAGDEAAPARVDSPWDPFLWPPWLPVRARMPLVAQITGAVALTALIIGPWWARIPHAPPLVPSTAVPQSVAIPLPAAVPQAPPPVSPQRAAHLNLQVRHSFGAVVLSVSVDEKPALETKLEGSGKKFGVFGKRAERGFTRTLDLAPGVRLVRVRVRSDADKFDETRVERFDLESASVVGLQVSADRSGLTLVAEHPPAPVRASAASPAAAPPSPAPAAVPAERPAVQTATPAPQQAGTSVDMLQSMRSMLIAIAGFVASTATAFVIQEFLRSRKDLLFEGERPRRRRKAISP